MLFCVNSFERKEHMLSKLVRLKGGLPNEIISEAIGDLSSVNALKITRKCR